MKRREMDYKVELSGSADSGSSLPIVDVSDIETIVSTWTGIPVERMAQDEKDKLLNLAGMLKSSLIGQDDAVDTVATSLVRARCGLKDPSRPIASLLLVGPTGEQRTARTIAREVASCFSRIRSFNIALVT